MQAWSLKGESRGVKLWRLDVSCGNWSCFPRGSVCGWVWAPFLPYPRSNRGKEGFKRTSPVKNLDAPLKPTFKKRPMLALCGQGAYPSNLHQGFEPFFSKSCFPSKLLLQARLSNGSKSRDVSRFPRRSALQLRF